MMPSITRLSATIPVNLHVPEPMRDAVALVLNGEYEAGFAGHDLVVLDIGANVGAFSIWASLRWPNSAIHAYEPHPETALILRQNVRHLPNIFCHTAAVYPSDASALSFFTRYPGDGESGLADCMKATFASLDHGRVLPVPLLHPGRLPPADVVKVDTEGSEADILSAMSLGRTSLVLLEFQCARNRDRIKQQLAADFVLEHEENHPWDVLLRNPEYRQDLAGDFYGLMFFANRKAPALGKLTR